MIRRKRVDIGVDRNPANAIFCRDGNSDLRRIAARCSGRRESRDQQVPEASRELQIIVVVPGGSDRIAELLGLQGTGFGELPRSSSIGVIRAYGGLQVFNRQIKRPLRSLSIALSP